MISDITLGQYFPGTSPIHRLDPRFKIILTILFMVCASSISDGIMFGILSYVLLNLAAGRREKLPATIWIIALLFVVKIIIGCL